MPKSMRPFCNRPVKFYSVGRPAEIDESACRRRLGHRGKCKALVEWDP